MLRKIISKFKNVLCSGESFYKNQSELRQVVFLIFQFFIVCPCAPN